jgi:chorismate dehydratase
MERKIRVSAVSYLNTIPFIYGIQQDKDLLSQVSLRLEYPSKCSDLLKSGKVDLGLVPVAEIPHINDAEIISDYCIGAEGKVNTVMLYSDCPLNEIRSIALDYQSRTSVMLTKVLVKNFWNIDVEYKETFEGYIQSIGGTNAGVVIGDRAFDLNGKFLYQYDLSEEWFKYTGLPFVFACWVANTSLPLVFKKQFSQAVALGVHQKKNAIDWFTSKEKSPVDLRSYLNKDISYRLDDRKRMALERFLDFIAAL